MIILPNRNEYDFKLTNDSIECVLDKITEEKGTEREGGTKIYVVCKKIAPTFRVNIVAGHPRDYHNMFYFFHLGTDLDGHRISFSFWTKDISAVVKDGDDCFVILTD